MASSAGNEGWVLTTFCIFQAGQAKKISCQLFEKKAGNFIIKTGIFQHSNKCSTFLFWQGFKSVLSYYRHGIAPQLADGLGQLGVPGPGHAFYQQPCVWAFDNKLDHDKCKLPKVRLWFQKSKYPCPDNYSHFSPALHKYLRLWSHQMLCHSEIFPPVPQLCHLKNQNQN